MKKVGLFFGTFNPIHVGHLILANHFAEFTDLDEVWFIVTPRSPFKLKATLLDNHHRYQLVYEAIEDYPKLKVSDIEFTLPQPNYTIDTLVQLSERYDGDYKFVLLMGEDNVKGLKRWKNYEAILTYYSIYVYPRKSNAILPEEFNNHPKIRKVEAPLIEISSTFIREQHRAGKNVRPMLPEGVWKYMDEMNFYR
jgi:nicotinate-nucleotide adenylyltransferase